MTSSLNHGIFAQIKNLVQGLTNKKSSKNVKSELNTLVTSCGIEAEKYMLICMLESTEFKDAKVQAGSKDQTRIQVLSQKIQSFANNDHFLDHFNQVLESVAGKYGVTDYVIDMIKILKLPINVQILIAISLVQSIHPSISREAIPFLKSKLNEYMQGKKHHAFSEKHHNSIMYLLKINPEFEDLVEEKKFIFESISDSSSSKLEITPYLIDKIEDCTNNEARELDTLYRPVLNISAKDVLAELGPACTQTLANLSLTLTDFILDEDTILQTLLMMSNTASEYDEANSKTVNLAFQGVRSKAWPDKDDIHDKKGLTITWNIDNFLKACIEKSPNLKWTNVIKKLDRGDLYIKDPEALLYLFKCFHKMKRFNTFNFPGSILFERWKNPNSQAKFLINLIEAGQPESVFFHESPKKTVSLELYPNLKISSLTPPVLQFFSCLDINEILIELSESDYYVEIRKLFELPMTRCPDLLILALAQIRPKIGMPLIDELYSHLIPLYLSNHASSMEILEAIWKTNPSVMISTFSELYMRDNSSLNLSRVLDISQEIKDSLLPIVNCRDYNFSVSLGILAAKRDFLHLDQWIAKRIRAIGNPFISAILKYVEDFVFEPCRSAPQSHYENILERSQLSLESLTIIFQTLMNPNLEDKISPKNKKILADRYQELVKFFPNVVAETPWTEIEVAANALFESTFDEKISIPELIDIMNRYKNSTVHKEKNIYLCIITNLLDEARFFHTYKTKILNIMAQIYGAVLNNNLVDGQARDVTFKIVIENIRQKEDKKLYEFGLKALEIFKSRLFEWPTKASQLFSIENLRERNLDLLEEIRYIIEAKGVQLDLPSDYPSYVQMRAQEKGKGSKLHPSTPFIPTQQMQTNQMNPQMMGYQQQPQKLNPNSFQGSLFPNQELRKGSPSPLIEQSNQVPMRVDPKKGLRSGEEIMSVLNVGGPGLGGNPYLVSPILQNNSSSNEDSNPRSNTPEILVSNTPPPTVPSVTLEMLYRGFEKEASEIDDNVKSKIVFSLNNLGNNNVDEKASEIKPHLNDENVLRWLSKYIVYNRATTEQNFHNAYISLVTKIGKKEILRIMTKETCKILHRAVESPKLFSTNEKESQEFTKTNFKNLGSFLGLLTLARNRPILMKEFDVKRVLVDSYDQQRMDFIVPFICKILSGATQNGSIFKPNNAWMNAILSLLAEINTMDIKMALKCEVEILFRSLEVEKDIVIPSKFLQNRGKKKEQRLNENQLTINELPQYIQIDPRNLGKFEKKFDLRGMVAQALDSAIKEIIPLVISRSVTITLITTKELVLKDFALEPDEKKLARGADLVVQNLAGNLALVTSREPLKLSFQGILRNLLDQTELDEPSKENIVQTVCVDNLDLGCALIKKAVIEKARDDVTQDTALIEATEKRKAARLSGMPFYDDNIYHATFQQIPEALRPSIGGLTKDQMRIYEDFGKTAKVNIMKGPTRMSTKGGKELDPDSVEVISRFEQYIVQLDKDLEFYLEHLNPEKLKELQLNHKKTMEYVTSSGANEEVIYECAIRILDPLINDQFTGKKVNFFLAVLQEFRKYDENLPNDILEWITVPTEKRIAKADFFIKLIKDNFVNAQELDNKFFELLEHHGSNSLIYSSIFKIVKHFVIDEKLFEAAFFQKSIPLLLKYLNQYRDATNNPKTAKIFEDFRNALLSTSNLNNQTRPKISPVADPYYKTNLQQALQYFRDGSDSEIYDFANKKMTELLTIENENEMTEFIAGLEASTFSNNETFIKFLTYMVDICVDDAIASLEKFGQYGGFNFLSAFDFTSIDCLSRFFIMILRTIINIPRNEIFEKILQAIVLILTKNHDLHREKFNQRPFYRLFYTLIYDIKRPEFNFNPQEINNYLQILMKVFDRLQPLKYPGFAFAWFDLISGRNFMPLVLLSIPNKVENWQLYNILLVDTFRFFKDTMETDIFRSDVYKNFYKGMLKTLLVLLHDFPEFLIESSFILIENVPKPFLQVKNVILSAFPQNMKVPDPFRTMDGIESKEEFRTLPNSIFNFEERVVSIKLHEEILKYLSTKNEVSEIHFRSICSKLLIQGKNEEITINYPVVNSFVLFIPWIIFKGQVDTQKINEWKQDSYELFLKLLGSSNPVMREALLNAIFNQVRYPNLITFYFAGLIFHIFNTQNPDETLLEQAFKMLFERLVVEVPRPWGLVFILCDLIKEKDFFKKKPFKNNPEFMDMMRLLVGKTESEN